MPPYCSPTSRQYWIAAFAFARFRHFSTSLGDLLLAPARACPDDLGSILAWILEKWADFLPDSLKAQLMRAQDRREEENRFRGFGPGPVRLSIPIGGDGFFGAEDPNLALAMTWIDAAIGHGGQAYLCMRLTNFLSAFNREIRTLDAVPDEVLEEFWGTSRYHSRLIGIWERSRASCTVKQRMGDGDIGVGVLHLGLRGRRCLWTGCCGSSGRTGLACMAFALGPIWFPTMCLWTVDGWRRIRIASFNSIICRTPTTPSTDPTCLMMTDGDPFGRRLLGPRDAAVVFRHTDVPGRVRYIYHGNDGTQMPWNDTAQLDYTLPETREAVIQALLNVARRFPIIRLDAAMTLARKHVQRLWFPPPERVERSHLVQDYAITQAGPVLGCP